MHTVRAQRIGGNLVVHLADGDSGVVARLVACGDDGWVTGSDPADADAGEGVGFGEGARDDGFGIGEGEDGGREGGV